VNPSATSNWALYRASLYGRVDLVRQLIHENGIDPSANANVAIRMAAENGHLELVHVLLQDSRVIDLKESSNLLIRLILLITTTMQYDTQMRRATRVL
jgi:hypothetical protein